MAFKPTVIPPPPLNLANVAAVATWFREVTEWIRKYDATILHQHRDMWERQQPCFTITNETERLTMDADTITLEELADFVATLAKKFNMEVT